ncbi:MAG: type II toxin-antitoxin system HicA family toxin [bacterium]|nr:type II toxin-antitoxin system HicA family toxin [bacterium]
MPKLPVVKAKEAVRVILKLGFTQHGHMKGSHMVLKHNDGRRTTIPMHCKDIPTGTLLAILRDMKISKEEFIKILKNN